MLMTWIRERLTGIHPGESDGPHEHFVALRSGMGGRVLYEAHVTGQYDTFKSQ